MKRDATNSIDDLARASEALRRAKEKYGDACKAVETAKSVLDRANAILDEHHKEIERLRGQVRAIAATLAE